MQETSLLANVRQATGIESFRRNKAIVLLGVRVPRTSHCFLPDIVRLRAVLFIIPHT